MLAIALPVAVRFARVLDALVLGESTAISLGIAVPRMRLLLVVLMALCTGAAVRKPASSRSWAWSRRTWCAARSSSPMAPC